MFLYIYITINIHIYVFIALNSARSDQVLDSIDLTVVSLCLPTMALALGLVARQECNLSASQKDGKARSTALDKSTTLIEPPRRYNGTDQRVLFRMIPQSLGWALGEAVQTLRPQQRLRTIMMEDLSSLEAGGVEKVCLLALVGAGAVVRQFPGVTWDRGIVSCVAVAPFVGMPLQLGVKDAIVGSEPILHLVPWLSAGIAPRIVWLCSPWQSNLQQVVIGLIDQC